MSIETTPNESPLETIKRETSEVRTFSDVILKCLQGLASLKLTVALFALAIILVLAGTLAQHRKDIWLVVEQYFRVPFWPQLGFAYFEFQDLLPTSFFGGKLKVPGGFYFPGGTLIGCMMAVNLLAAHGLRFKPQAKGERLWGGLGVIAVGLLVTAGVILSGSNKAGVHQSIWMNWGGWGMLWRLMQAGLFLSFLLTSAGFVWLILRGKSQNWFLAIAGMIPATLGALTVYTIYGGEDVALDAPSMRILWQLMKGTIAGLVLLGGCVMVFKKRAGVVLLHAGVGLMMFSEVQVALTAVEGQMWIQEGESVNFVRDVRKIELAVIDQSDPEKVTATVVPESVLLDEGKISDEQLPFNIEVVKFLRNSEVNRIGAGDENPATTGAGTQLIAKEVRAGTGTDTGGALDMSAAYVKLTSKDGKQDLGTYLVSIWFDSPVHVNLLRNMPIIRFTGELPQTVDTGDKQYKLALRYKRTYMPYTMRLNDIRKSDYLGTSQVKDYSSYVRLTDPSRHVDREKIRIWMNNPLRFAGQTFYQSNYIADPFTGKEATSLSVVTNSGWMIPYVSCMIVATGLLAHFILVLVRFLNRQQREVFATELKFDDDDSEELPKADASAGKPSQSSQARRRSRERKLKERRAKRKNQPIEPALSEQSSLFDWIVPLALVFLCAAYVGSKARMPGKPKDGMNLYEFGKIPIVYQGRQKPLDTLARNSLRIISNRQTFYGRMTDEELKKNWPKITEAVQTRWPKLSGSDLKSIEFDVDKLIEVIETQTGDDHEQIVLFVDRKVNVKEPAIRWLLDVITRPDRAESHKVVRIENLEVLDTLGLPRRDGFRYAVGEFRSKLGEVDKQVELARAVRKETPEQLSTYQKKILELDTRVRTFTLLVEAFQLPSLPTLPRPEELTNPAEREAAMKKSFPPFQAAYLEAKRRQEFFQKFSPPLLVPVDQSLKPIEGVPAVWKVEREEWETYSTAWLNDFARQRLFGETTNSATLALQDIFVAYAIGEAEEFNTAVAEYQELLSASSDLPVTSMSKTRFEAFFNHFEPFFYSILLYLFAFVLACVAWLAALVGFRKPLNNAATWVIAGTLLLHSFALISRMYISGRPPVTNLYSSAVFIGWGAVILGLLFEMIFRIGIGNMIASVSGFATLWIAHLLAGDGDTFTVLQAVLDTQFWLATHVTSITLGYATTYVAGLLGLTYIFFGMATPVMNRQISSILGRMIYGTLCFAILFSFVGTVLGGLWADDSWGRFWGWDPKENGALIIVLWNALVLHARWDGMVKDRGMAVLAIGGNIVTSWSWFGVNELGVGLHSYGFTEGVLLALAVFASTQLLAITVGCLPKTLWWSFREQEKAARA